MRMQRVKRFIEFHACEKIGLADVAAEAGLSSFALVRQFRAATGKTPYGYILELRLSLAKTLLANGELPIVTVSSRAGFPDPAYFSRFFKASVGCSPSAYRTMHSPSVGLASSRSVQDNPDAEVRAERRECML